MSDMKIEDQLNTKVPPTVYTKANFAKAMNCFVTLLNSIDIITSNFPDFSDEKITDNLCEIFVVERIQKRKFGLGYFSITLQGIDCRWDLQLIRFQVNHIIII